MIDFKLLIAQLSRQAQTLVPQRAPAFAMRGVSWENSRCSQVLTPGRGHCLRQFQLSAAEGAADPASPLGQRTDPERIPLSNYFGKKNPCMSRKEGIGVPAMMLPLALTAVYYLACKRFGCYTWQPITCPAWLSDDVIWSCRTGLNLQRHWLTPVALTSHVIFA